MKKRRDTEDKVVMDATPMIDVTFQLLIFFIITLKFKVLEKKLVTHLPTDFGSGVEQSPVEETFSEVRLSQHVMPGQNVVEGRTSYALDGVPLRGSGREALGELERRLRSLRGRIRDLTGKIRVDRGVPHARVVEVVDVMRRAGCPDIRFSGMKAVKDIDAFRRVLEQRGQQPGIHH